MKLYVWKPDYIRMGTDKVVNFPEVDASLQVDSFYVHGFVFSLEVEFGLAKWSRKGEWEWSSTTATSYRI
jgi:hypothetical protein